MMLFLIPMVLRLDINVLRQAQEPSIGQAQEPSTGQAQEPFIGQAQEPSIRQAQEPLAEPVEAKYIRKR
jgi:hypothetical protein